MKLNYAESDEDCIGCGATAGDRLRNQPAEPQGTWVCQHCGGEKCAMCCMGDDVECGNCDSEADGD